MEQRIITTLLKFGPLWRSELLDLIDLDREYEQAMSDLYLDIGDDLSWFDRLLSQMTYEGKIDRDIYGRIVVIKMMCR